MTSFNPDDLYRTLNAWLNSRYLRTISAVEGGWEYWIQIDYMSWLNLHNTYDVRREVPIGGARADLFLNFGAGIGVPPPQPFPPCWIEIKAQGAKYLNEAFKKAVQADIDKMAALGAGCWQYMLVALSDAGLITDPMFSEANGYIPVWQDNDTGVRVLLKRTA